MSVKEIEWTNEQVIRLVNEYKAKPMLWDPNHDLYRVQTAKYEAWCELAELYGCEIVELRKKFNSIFASHRREKAKIRMGGKSSWFLYNYLSYLPSHLETEESSDPEREVVWPNDQIIRLVKEYEAKPMLWDPNNVSYRRHTAKNNAWCELATSFGCEIADLRKKLDSLFASYRREKTKILQGTRSNWFLYDYFNYMPGHVANYETSDTTTKPRKQKSYIEERIEESEPSSEDYENHEDETPVHIIIKEEPEIKTPPKLKYFRPKPSLTRVVKRRIIKENQIDRNKILDKKYFKRSQLYKKKDEYDSFGEYIAISLRKHDERTRSMIKQAINNILFEQEMKKYNNSGQYAVVLGMEDNPLIVPDDCDK